MGTIIRKETAQVVKETACQKIALILDNKEINKVKITRPEIRLLLFQWLVEIAEVKFNKSDYYKIISYTPTQPNLARLVSQIQSLSIGSNQNSRLTKQQLDWKIHNTSVISRCLFYESSDSISTLPD